MAVVSMGLALAACPSGPKWQHHDHYKTVGSYGPVVGGGPGPQLDKGTFQGRVPGKSYPVVWAWKPKSHPKYEVWVTYKPGVEFKNIGTSPDMYLTLHWDKKDDYGDPLPGQNGPTNFRTHVKNWYTANHSALGVQLSDLTTVVTRTEPDTGTPTSGMFEPGLYKVWQTNHDPYVGPPLAWVWQPANAENRNIWLVYKEGEEYGFHLPGAVHPVTNQRYDMAGFRFQRYQDVITADIDTQYALAIQQFKDWVVNEPTNDVDNQSEIEPVKYDHRILQGP